MAGIPEKHRDLFDKPVFASLATIMPDGTPQVTPVWCDYDGRHIIINTAKGRVKDRNMRRNPAVALAVMDPANPYRYLEVRGKVTEITEQGADGRSRVPLLGDIPVVGWLFGQTTARRTRQELLVFLTPTVLRSRTPCRSCPPWISTPPPR